MAPAGAALELFQSAALIHDDVIDRSDTRRDRPGGRPKMTRPDSSPVTDASRNTPPEPNHSTPTSTPASAGPMTRIPSCEVWLRVIASWICSASTSSVMNAMRAGR